MDMYVAYATEYIDENWHLESFITASLLIFRCHTTWHTMECLMK